MEGVFFLSKTFDSAGPMAKSARDILPLLEILLQPPRHFEYKEDWKGLSVGFVDLDIWKIWESHCRQHPGTLEQMVRNSFHKTIQAFSDKSRTEGRV
jgi:amidase